MLSRLICLLLFVILSAGCGSASIEINNADDRLVAEGERAVLIQKAEDMQADTDAKRRENELRLADLEKVLAGSFSDRLAAYQRRALADAEFADAWSVIRIVGVCAFGFLGLLAVLAFVVWANLSAVLRPVERMALALTRPQISHSEGWTMFTVALPALLGKGGVMMTHKLLPGVVLKPDGVVALPDGVVRAAAEAAGFVGMAEQAAIAARGVREGQVAQQAVAGLLELAHAAMDSGTVTVVHEGEVLDG